MKKESVTNEATEGIYLGIFGNLHLLITRWDYMDSQSLLYHSFTTASVLPNRGNIPLQMEQCLIIINNQEMWQGEIRIHTKYFDYQQL